MICIFWDITRSFLETKLEHCLAKNRQTVIILRAMEDICFNNKSIQHYLKFVSLSSFEDLIGCGPEKVHFTYFTISNWCSNYFEVLDHLKDHIWGYNSCYYPRVKYEGFKGCALFFTVTTTKIIMYHQSKPILELHYFLQQKSEYILLSCPC